MKKIIFVFMLILVMSTTVFASNVSVKINNDIVNFKDENGNIVNAQIINDRTMVPMRKIFEILGAEIEWDGENRIVTGTKDDTKIKLQINNNVATKTVNGVEEKIILDTPPMIVNDRTMVPLRFIAESLDKQVGWDNQNRTAIIIDYDYFANQLKSKAPALYNFLNMQNSNVECNLTHKYSDLENAANSTTSVVKINATIQNNVQNISLNITGTDELSKEISSEGWSNTSFYAIYGDENVAINTSNAKLKEMFGIGNEDMIKTYSELNLIGVPSDSFGEMFETWASIDDSELNVNTFSKLQNDFNTLCNLFSTTNTSNIKLSSVSSNINYDSYKIEYFDLAKLDNFISSNDYLKVCNLVNQLFFKYDVQKDVILYDSSNVSIKFNIDNSSFNATIEMINDYNEKDEYIINVNVGDGLVSTR